MKTTRILWSGLTGRTGREAIKQLTGRTEVADVEIVGGFSRTGHDYHCENDYESRSARYAQDAELAHFVDSCEFNGVKWYKYFWLSEHHIEKPRPQDYDVLVDFSHPDVFEQVLDLAVADGKPLISGTSGLSNLQMAMLDDATKIIPIFRGGNFRFKVKKFIDEAVRLAMNTTGELTLYENFYEGKNLPSETSKVIKRRIFEATGKTIIVHSTANLPKENLQCNWRLDLGTELRNGLSCNVVGLDELTHDVLEIAKVMAKKPVKKDGGFYTLDDLWDELVSYAL